MATSSQEELFLAVDDSQESLELLRIILNRYFPHTRVLTALGGLEGLELAQREHPDLILLDVKMPDVDGFEFARRLRANTVLATIPILMISGVVTDVQGRITGLEAGAESFLVKPFEPMELVAQVRALLRIRRSEEALRAQHAQLEVELERRTQKLRESELKFRMLFENLPDAVFVEDAHGVVLDVNLAACRLHETTREQLVGAAVETLVPVEQREQVRRDFPKWFLTDTSQYASHSLTATGRVVPVEIKARKIEYNGQPAMLLHVRDLGERRRAEEERNRLILALEQSAEAIFITDAQGIIQYANRAAEQITGYLRAEVLGRRPSLFKSGKHDAEFYQQMWATLRHGSVWSGHIVNKRKDGRLFQAELTISPVRDPRGTLINFVAVSRDITHEVELEEQLHQAQKMDSIGRLAGGVAHDFNNLLTSILGFAHIVYDGLPQDDPLLRDTKEIIYAAERAAQLTRQLLAFSRKQVTQVQALNLNTVLREMEQLLRRTLGEDVELLVDLDPNLGRCQGDLMQMQQVILNLIINARDAMPRGGQLVVRTAGVDLDEAFCQMRVGIRPGRHIRLSVRDNGCGIPEEMRRHIFEPFFTTKEEERGTGLGLSMVYAIVQQARGHVEFESETGQGTEFIVHFPQMEKDPGGVAGGAASPRARGGDETILMVEDDELVRDLGVRLLSSLGYRVLPARNARDAETIFRQHKEPIHLVLTDVVMPQVGGSELVQRLTGIRKNFKVLYVSGFTEDTIVQHGIKHQNVNFLPKPFTRETLGVKVREILDGGGAPPPS
ncbi:MAG: PAS domain S-box protein [Verrucomicrobia bacterium]|nr:MAG: PAS domain S-box protein [Verrucomicrobiota bacterium]